MNLNYSHTKNVTTHTTLAPNNASKNLLPQVEGKEHRGGIDQQLGASNFGNDFLYLLVLILLPIFLLVVFFKRIRRWCKGPKVYQNETSDYVNAGYDHHESMHRLQSVISLSSDDYLELQPYLDLGSSTSQKSTGERKLSTTYVSIVQAFNEAFPGKFIKIDKLQFGDKLSAGAFGDVFRGSLMEKDGDSQSIIKRDVAIKTLKKYDQMKLLKEAKISFTVEHKHVLTLIGVCIDAYGYPKSLVFPFMINGDLKKYLETNDLSKDILLGFTTQIVIGMDYLTSKNIIHRDLAARNCFLDEELVVKIADFGLARVSSDNQVRQATSLIPQASAPEAIFTGFNELTDVWSFGITLVEIFNRGTFLTIGAVKLDIPPLIIRIIERCLSKEPENRPTFDQLLRIFKNTKVDDLEMTNDQMNDNKKGIANINSDHDSNQS